MWSGNEVKGQYAGRFFPSARAALDEVTRITLYARKQSDAASLPPRRGAGVGRAHKKTPPKLRRLFQTKVTEFSMNF